MTKKKAAPYWTDGRRDAERLKPHPRNSKTHPPEQIESIAASIREFGFTRPLLIDDKNTILAGHGARLAVMVDGMEDIARDVPVRIGHNLTDDQKLALVIADNRLTELGQWDRDLLAGSLGDLVAAGFNIDLSGFNSFDLENLRLERQFGENDPSAEWQGMPEFDQVDKTAFRSLAIHFKDQAAVDKFARLIKQKITPNTRFVWFPEIEIETYADKRYANRRRKKP